VPINIHNDDIETAILKLKAREDTLRQLEAVSRLGSWEIDLATKQSFWSKRSYEMYGVKENTLVNLDTFFSMLLPEDEQKVQNTLTQIIQTQETASITCRLKRTDGVIINLLINGRVIFNKDGTPSKIIGTTQDISEYVSLSQHAKVLSDVLEYSSSEIYIVSLDTLNYLYVNQGACDALGYTKEELLDMNITNINPYLDKTKIKKLKNELKDEKKILNRTIHKCKDGSTYHVQSHLHTLEYQQQQACVIFCMDISQTVALRKTQRKQARVLDYIHDSVISTDLHGTITSWNNGSSVLFGYKAKEMLGKNILETYDVSNEYTTAELFKLLNEQGNLVIEAYMLKKDKSRIICDVSLSVSKDELDKIDGYIGYIQDITKQKKTQSLLDERTQQLEYQANHDALTHLPNRALFRDRLSQSIATAKRNEEKFALMFIDLDQFKKINDSLGHHIGDLVLIEAGNRIKNTIREEDTLARLGGDEFTIILKDIITAESASTVAQKIVDIMKKPIKISGQNLYVTASIGLSLYPKDSTNDNNLIKYADVAMYKAKDEGRNNYQFYSSDMTSFAFEKVVMESSLRIAIKEEQFVVYFQPQVDVKTEKIVGMEALVRWQHPSSGLIAPGVFLNIAEESGLIIDIDKIVMKKSLTYFSKWYKEGLNPGKLSVNLAMKQLNEDNFLPYLLQTMKELDFQASWLELEVTEGQVMYNPESSIRKLKQLSEIGIEIAIDDFGTGYSSLSYLKKLPLDKLKIDQSFIRDIPKDEDDMAITKAIIALGKSLNLTLIAEGVETQAQKNFILENDCELIQGYYYSKPLPSEEIEKLLRDQKLSISNGSHSSLCSV